MQSIESVQVVNGGEDISRESCSSSPIPIQNPLTIRICSSPIEHEIANESTPIKKCSTNESCSNNGIATPNERVAFNGLLSYSTPLFFNRTNFQAYSTPTAFSNLYYLYKNSPYFEANHSNLSSNNRTESLKRNKPKVNFHSIDELASGADLNSNEENDSGFSSYMSLINSRLNFPTPTSTANHLERSQYLADKLPSENSNHKDLSQESFTEDDKENSEMLKKAAKSKNDEKKVRTAFTDYQKKMLEYYFHKNCYPDPRETEELSQQLVLPENVIKVWFQNKRSRDKQRKSSKKFNSSNNINNSNNNSSSSYSSSPLIANLQLLSSKINSAASNKPLYKQNNLFF